MTVAHLADGEGEDLGAGDGVVGGGGAEFEDAFAVEAEALGGFEWIEDVGHGEGDLCECGGVEDGLRVAIEQGDIEAIVGVEGVHAVDHIGEAEWVGGGGFEQAIDGGAVADEEAEGSGLEGSGERKGEVEGLGGLLVRAEDGLDVDAIAG